MTVQVTFEDPELVEFLCPCGSLHHLQRLPEGSKPRALRCDCGREFLAWHFPGKGRVWWIREKKED